MSGTGKISLALGGAKKGKPAPTNGVKRSHAALNDGDDDEQLEGKAQTVSHFDRTAGGAIDEANKAKKEQPLVIQPQANRDWKEASQRNKRQRLPEALRQNDRAAEVEAKERSSKPTFGLNVKKNGEASTSEPMDVETQEQAQEVPLEANGEASIAKKTDEEEAMDALLGRTKRSDLVLPAMSEEEAFERDFHSAPDMATLDDYARVPVEQFGAALLRGMGWKEGMGIGSQRDKKVETAKVPARRPALLGIGAKEEAAVKEEMGAWGKATRGKDPKIYAPVLLRDRQTGEMFTEEELAKKKVDDERKTYELEFDEKERKKERERRERDDSRDGGRRDKDRRKEKDGNDRDRRRDDSDDEYYRRKEEKRKRREREREESDEEYYRRKEKDKKRRERDRDHRDSDRDRSRRHDGSRERRRDRDGDRKRRD